MPLIYWFTGQPGSGKTTLCEQVKLGFKNGTIIHIDGDDLRDIFQNKDYSESGRRKNIERAQDIAQFMLAKGYDVLVSLVSPYKDQRESFKTKCNIIEIYVHTVSDRGRTQYHVAEYEPPTEKFIDIDTTNSNVMDSYEELLNKIIDFKDNQYE